MFSPRGKFTQLRSNLFCRLRNAQGSHRGPWPWQLAESLYVFYFQNAKYIDLTKLHVSLHVRNTNSMNLLMWAEADQSRNVRMGDLVDRVA